jgi:hypothetical protein
MRREGVPPNLGAASVPLRGILKVEVIVGNGLEGMAGKNREEVMGGWKAAGMVGAVCAGRVVVCLLGDGAEVRGGNGTCRCCFSGEGLAEGLAEDRDDSVEGVSVVNCVSVEGR